MKRLALQQKIAAGFKVTSCVALLGPRQCGKTTEARVFATEHKLPPQNYFDLENANDVSRLIDPLLALSSLSGLIIIDEVQVIPELFKTLRVMIDDPNLKQHYLILGSASRELIRQSSETLAGRISYIDMSPLTYIETHEQSKLWLRGGFPLSYLATDEEISFAWRQAYIKTYLEQDIPNLGIKIPAENLRRLWLMLAHAQGSTLNASDLGRSLGLTNKTIQSYLDILSGTFMVRQLKPWFENISKRQVKAPKIYVRDTGILHTLLGIKQESDLLVNQKLGASWESFILEQLIQGLEVDSYDCYFWATYQGAELDLLVFKDGKRIGFEIKYTSTPKLTKSMQTAIENLKLDQLSVIYPGNKRFPLSENIHALPLTDVI